MLKYFVWVPRDLLFFGILVALIAALFFKNKEESLQKKIFSYSLIFGTGFSVLLAVLKGYAIIRKYQFVKLYLAIIVLVCGILFAACMWLFMGGALSKRRPLLENLSTGILGGLFCAALMSCALPDFFLFPSGFKILGETALSTDFLFKSIMYGAGILLVFLVLLCVFFIAKNLSSNTVKVASSVLIFLTLLDSYAKLLNALNGRKIIRLRRGSFSLLFVRWDLKNQLFFVFVALFVVIVLAVILVWLSTHDTTPYQNSAEHRRIRALCRNKRRWAFAYIVLALLSVIDLTVLKRISEKVVSLSAAEPFMIEGTKITVPLESVSDGNLHRFEYFTSDDIGIRFIIIQKNAFAFGVGFDACEICGATGYYQKNGQVICKLCEVVMNINTIGYKGGCNPIPLAYEIDSGSIVIDTADLEVEKNRFR